MSATLAPPSPPDTQGTQRPTANPNDVPIRHKRPGLDALLRIRNWRVRRKLGAVLIIPTLAFLVVGGLDTARAIGDARALSDVAERTAAGDAVLRLVHELQRERDRTAGYLVVSGRDGAEAESTTALAAVLNADVQAVDGAVSVYRNDSADLPDRAAADAALDELGELRVAARGGGLRQRAVFDQYTQIIGALLDVLIDATVAGGTAAVDADLARNFGSLADLYRVEELEAQIRGRLYAISSAGDFTQGEFQAFADLRAQRADAIARFRSEASGPRLSVFDNLVKGQATLAANRIEQTAVDRSQAGGLGMDPEQWWSASTTKLELIDSAVRQLFTAVVDETDRQSSSQVRRTVLGTVAVVLILLVAVLASLAIGRSMVRTLGNLRTQAHAVARRRLPEVVRLLNTPSAVRPRIQVQSTTVDSLDEIGEVADAFDAVHRQAVRLAAEQADLRRSVSVMFASLARRSQALVERQLSLIDSLEEVEEDPDLLDNLFKLDHLATRMRRNNDNLLVIAGAESYRRSMDAVSLADVMLAASAEIEQYTRVRYTATDDLAIVGHAAADLVHLLAELIDNATAFSPPDSVVQVTEHKVADGAVITVEDTGVGMSPTRMAHANHRLAHPGGADASVPEQMGLFVVAKLGDRHEIKTELRHGRYGGVVSVTWVPMALLTKSPGRLAIIEPPDETKPGQDGASLRRGLRLADLPGLDRTSGRSRMWWSREAAMVAKNREQEAATDPAAQGTRPLVTVSFSNAGLPVRVPDANRPAEGRQEFASSLPAPEPAAAVPAAAVPAGARAGGRLTAAPLGLAAPPAPDEVEPERDSAVLSALYRGIREADQSEPLDT